MSTWAVYYLDRGPTPRSVIRNQQGKPRKFPSLASARFWVKSHWGLFQQVTIKQVRS